MTPKKNKPTIHPLLKMYSGFAPDAPDEDVRRYFEVEFPTLLEKPCGILMWCPYGPLVEDFPLHGVALGDRQPCADAEACGVFGHDCPVFYVAEPLADLDAVAENCICDDCRRKMEELELESVDSEQPDSEDGVSPR